MRLENMKTELSAKSVNCTNCNCNDSNNYNIKQIATFFNEILKNLEE